MSEAGVLPPLLHDVLRTGRVPSAQELAKATGKHIDEVRRFLASAEPETSEPAPEDDLELQRLSEKYRLLTADACAAWLEDNFTLDHQVPADIRANIEAHCNAQIQRELREHRGRQQVDEEKPWVWPGR